MDLTTTYEDEEVDEDEKRRREEFHRSALYAKVLLLSFIYT